MIAPAVLPWVPDMLNREANTKSNRISVWVGFIYLLCSLSCSVSYIVLLGPAMTNNLYWPHYNTTGYQVFLIDLLNVKLQTASHDDSVNLLSIDATMLKSYASSAVQPDFYNNYARRVLLSELNTLEKGIQGTRNTPKARMASPYAQYCWVDFNRRWDIAHTDARSQRCRQRYQDNAAIYLEFLVRNVDWGEFLAANIESWPVVIGLALQSTAEGIQWLADRPMHSLALAVEAEVAYLVALNLTRYELQWQNDIQIGLVESIEIQNTLNAQRSVLLKAMNHAWAPWTSLFMYWNFRNDLGTLRVLNMSLVRGAPNYFQTVGGSDFFSTQLGLQDANGNYDAQTWMFHTSIGPFGSVDLLYVQLPQSVMRLYSYVTKSLQSVALDTVATITFTSLPPNFNQPGLTYYGGNVLCMSNAPTSFPQPPLSFDDTCSGTAEPFAMMTTLHATLFSLVVSRATSVESICGHQTSLDCHAFVAAGLAMVPSIRFPPANALSNRAIADLPAIQWTQYAQDDATSQWLFLQQPLLTPHDPHWSFFGWLALLDWAEGRREVLSIEGDIATIVVMSDAALTYHATMGGNNAIAQSGPEAIYYLILYTTLVLLCLGVAVLACVARDRYHVRGRNLFMFHRVAAFVWIGRPLLLLRGLTAVILLCTPRAILTVSNEGLSALQATPFNTWDTLLVAGEASWVVFVVSDFLLVGFESVTTVKYEAPLASTLAWGATSTWVLSSPLALTANLARDCTTTTAQEYVFCHSGVVVVGHWHRVLGLFAIDIAALLVAHGMLRYVSRNWHHRFPAPWHVHGTVQGFFDVRSRDHRHEWELDSAASVMSGSLPFKLAGHPYAFDVKLWVVHLSHRDGMIPQSTGSSLHAVTFKSESKSWSWYVVLGLGICYLGLTTVGSVSYIALSQINFANDFYWATFNMTGHHVAIADWFHLQLALDGNATAIRLDNAQYNTMEIDFANPALQIASSPWYGARLQFEYLNKLPAAIQGLRRTDGCEAPWISSQYCWLDLKRQWPMANSHTRQERCMLAAENGALYMEAVLRNIQWLEFDHCWGHAFNIAFRSDLERDVRGKQWLSSVQESTTSVDEEVTYWMKNGILHYTVQWQNFKLPGLINTYVIENAFGAQYPMTLSHSNGSFTLTAPESYKMYWNLASDFWAVAQNQTSIGGQSLLRTSAHFAFANHTMLDVLVQNATLSLPLAPAFQLVQTHVGPFGSIEMKTIPCPATVKSLLASGVAVLREAFSTNVSAASAYINIAAAILNVHFALPTIFMAIPDWIASGGNLLCPEVGNNAIKYGLYQFTGRSVACGQWIATLLQPSKDIVLVAALSAGLAHPLADIQSVCAHDTDPNLCLHGFLGPSMGFLQTFVHAREIVHLEALAATAILEIRSIEPSLMQYVRENATEPLEMLTYALLNTSDPTYAFWSWLYVFEWATAEREVISFQGDVGTMNIITESTPPIRQQVQANELPTTFTYYTLGGVQYITWLLLGLSVLVLVYAATSRLHIEATNLFKVNRVAGIVWIGRPLLLLRSITALCLLSTATLTLEIENHVSGFRVPRLPWYKTILGAGETTWLVYILNDVLTVWTKQYTAYYGSPHSLLVWFVAAIFTLVQPVEHTATIHPVCQIDRMDFQIVCCSGVVTIGQVARIYSLVAIVGFCNILTYGVARIWTSKHNDDNDGMIQYQHLSSGARYFLNQTHWVHQGIYYIDPASAVLNGLIMIPWRESIYFIDVKLWRSFSIPTANTNDVPPRFQRSLPLTE
ncbi:Aste57867_8691 [Aphanomyces stellatus]|uniref:Aste57867_8691 protein n=1 Tax=Aphanomyces stellatus TaxID=120398 RepID=A0A485KKZ8_9STRA|nr:hypothetical protein As57867_008657 [Aphanomyces stellatus]VFT85577.1 Aste57867_8691 [Aphanomyces stellatus]